MTKHVIHGEIQKGIGYLPSAPFGHKKICHHLKIFLILAQRRKSSDFLWQLLFLTAMSLQAFSVSLAVNFADIFWFTKDQGPGEIWSEHRALPDGVREREGELKNFERVGITEL